MRSVLLSVKGFIHKCFVGVGRAETSQGCFGSEQRGIRALTALLVVALWLQPVLLCAVAPSTALACWEPAPPELVRISLFRPDIGAAPGSSFLFKYWVKDFRDGWDYDDETQAAQNDAADTDTNDGERGNIDDWLGVLPGTAQREDVRDFVYESTQEELEEVRAALTLGRAYDGPLSDNAFVRHILVERDQDLLDYMIFAKDCAIIYSGDSANAWDYVLDDADADAVRLKEAEDRLAKVKTDFLRRRYLYQALRICRETEQWGHAVELFEAKAPALSKGEILFWCRLIYGDALAQTKRPERAFVEYALVFQHSTRYWEHAHEAARFVMPEGDSDYERTYLREWLIRDALKLCADDTERLATLCLAAYCGPRRSAYLHDFLEAVLKEGKPVPGTETVLLRVVNELEIKLMPVYSPGKRFAYLLPERRVELKDLERTPARSFAEPREEYAYYEGDDSTRIWPIEKLYTQANVRRELTALEDVLMKLHAQRQENTFFITVASYLAWLRGDNAQAAARLDAAKVRMAQLPSQAVDPKLRAQVRLLEFLYAADFGPLDAGGEDRLADHLAYFIKLSGREPGRLAQNRPLWRRFLGPDIPGPEVSEREPARKPAAVSPEQRWADRAVLNIVGHILAARYAAEGRGEMQVGAWALAEMYTQNKPDSYDFFGSRTFAAADNLPPEQLRRLNALLAHPKDRLQTLAAEACKAIYSPEFFAELEGVQYLRRYDFAHALATLPQQDGPESLSYRRKVLGPEKVEPDEAEVDTPGLAQAADALNGKVAAITGDGSGAGAPGSKELGTKAPGAQNSGVEATGWAAEEQGTFTVFGTEGGALPFYEDQETVTRMPEAMQRQAVAAFKAKAPAGYALAAPYLAVPFDFNPRGRRHFAAFMSMWDALRVEPGELGAHAAYYYADGLYHMGYYGRARFLSTWSKSWYYERRAYKDSQPEIRSYLGAPEDMEYHQALLAEKIFAQIPGRTTNRDLAACALFAAAQCLQTRSTTYECNSLDKDVPTGSFFTANPYFQALTTRYVDTAYSYAVYQTCSHLEDFVRLQHDPKRVPPSPYPEDKE